MFMYGTVLSKILMLLFIRAPYKSHAVLWLPQETETVRSSTEKCQYRTIYD